MARRHSEADTTEFGSVAGYRQERRRQPYAGVFVYAECRVATLAPMAWFEPVPALRLGPGRRSTASTSMLGSASYPEAGTVQSRSWKPGFVVEAALTVPVDTPVFFVALAQYRWAGSATAGPWAARLHTPVPTSSSRRRASRVSHAFVALGIGGRF